MDTESLEKIVNYFTTVHNSLILQTGDTSCHQGQLLADTGKAVLCAIDSINTDVSIIMALAEVCKIGISSVNLRVYPNGRFTSDTFIAYKIQYVMWPKKFPLHKSESFIWKVESDYFFSNGRGVYIYILFQQGGVLEPLKKTGAWFESLRSQLRQVRRHADVADLLMSQGSDLTGVTPHVITLARVISETATGLALTVNG